MPKTSVQTDAIPNPSLHGYSSMLTKANEIGYIPTSIRIHLKYLRALYSKKKLLTTVFSWLTLGSTTFVTPTALPTDAMAEPALKTNCLWLRFRIAERPHNIYRQTKAVSQRYKPHDKARVRKRTRFYVFFLLFADQPPLLTSVADKMPVQAY